VERTLAVPDAARLVVERLFLGPGERAGAVEPRGDAVLVSAGGRRYAVEPYRPPGARPLPADVTVLDVRSLPVPSPGGGPRGAALIAGPDGPEILDLSSAQGLRELVRRVHRGLDAEALATLLSRYAADGPHQNLITGPEDLSDVLEPALLRALGVPPLERRATDGGQEVSFATFFLRPEPPDGVFRVGLDRWRATVDADGGLDWSAEPLARLLPSPRYGTPTGPGR
jgi:hypothetical protein